ncbi:MAG: VCBS repeat-containing protein [Proteobacteria bacterium]|nr:VCBS repeat-containing protein [Pseudomonadota bacterium]
MKQLCGWFGRGVGVAAVLLAMGCQTAPVPSAPKVAGQDTAASRAGAPQAIQLNLPYVWGGQVICAASDCLLGVVEHENSKLSLLRLQGRTAAPLDRQPLAYHPDSAVWLSPQLLVAAVENSASLDIFQNAQDRLTKLAQVVVGFAPRDVIALPAPAGQYRMLATPYSGQEVAWVDWNAQQPEAAQVRKTRWCEAPWHPTRVSQLPQSTQGGVAVACLHDKKVVAVSDADLYATPKVLATFKVIPRQVRPSPSGLWLYVALETGGRNARIQMQTGELQWIAGDPRGSSAVTALTDDLVIWGDDRRLTLQRLDGAGSVLQTRELRTSGYSTGLQLQDIDGDGHPDIVVLNSAGKQADVIYGPLWEQAKPLP